MEVVANVFTTGQGGSTTSTMPLSLFDFLSAESFTNSSTFWFRGKWNGLLLGWIFWFGFEIFEILWLTCFLVYFSCRYFESFGFTGDGFNHGLGEQRKVVAWWSASSGDWWGQVWVCVWIWVFWVFWRWIAGFVFVFLLMSRFSDPDRSLNRKRERFKVF